MKILYGLPSEGMGHATRSKVIIEYLLQEHDVQVVTSDRAYSFLVQHFPNHVHQIDGFHLAYKNAVVSVSNTILMTLKNAPKNLLRNFNQYQDVIKNFNADIVISDFESFTFFYAKLHRKPLISIDNMQIINRAKLNIDIPSAEKANYLLAKNIIKAKVPHANQYLISTFFHPEIRKKNTTYIPPIIRTEIIKAKTSTKQHIFVYQTSSSQKNLIAILQQLPQEQFFVYGFNKDEQLGNVTLKSFSEAGFIKDFASAKAVFANGGFSFLSEAVYLQKPILSVPIKNQFEQFVNASYVEKLQYGRHSSDFTADNMKAFLYDLEIYKSNLKNYRQLGNEALFAQLKNTLSRF